MRAKYALRYVSGARALCDILVFSPLFKRQFPL